MDCDFSNPLHISLEPRCAGISGNYPAPEIHAVMASGSPFPKFVTNERGKIVPLTPAREAAGPPGSQRGSVALLGFPNARSNQFPGGETSSPPNLAA